MKHDRLIPLLLVVAIAVAFSEVRHQGFVAWDDDVNIYQNRRLQPPTPANILYFWRQPYFGMYIPVTYTVWGGLASIAARVPPVPGEPGPNPRVFHVANLALHVLNALLVSAILSLLLRAPWASAAGALLFALHPLQVEPVAWITGMKDVLGGSFSLLALWQYLLFAARARDGSGAGPRRLHYAAATAFFVLALLAKPSSVAVPVVAWVLDHWMLGRPARRCTPPLAAWAILGIPAIVVTKLAQDPGASVGFLAPFWARPFVAGDTLAFYLGKLLLPLRLCPDYGRSAASVLRGGQAYYTWLAPAALGALIWLGRRGRPWLVAAGCVSVAGLLPVLGLIRFNFQEMSTVADRYVYLAMLGPALALAGLLSQVPHPRLAAASGLLLALLGFLTAIQTLYWYGTIPLFEYTLTLNPRSTVAHNNLGAALFLRGKFAEAADHYAASLGIAPNEAPVRENLASALAAQGKMDEALRHWREALRTEPGYVRAYHNMGVALAARGKLDEAIACWSEALRIQPGFEPARRALAQARRLKGRGAKPGR